MVFSPIVVGHAGVAVDDFFKILQFVVRYAGSTQCADIPKFFRNKIAADSG